MNAGSGTQVTALNSAARAKTQTKAINVSAAIKDVHRVMGIQFV
jgi:hypothetical protein